MKTARNSLPAAPNMRRDPTPTASVRVEASGIRRAAQAIMAVRAADAREAARHPRASPVASWLARRFLALWTIAVLATAAAFVAHLALRFETVRLGYDVGHARREQRSLVEQRRLLSLEAATLGQADRVEAVARGSLGMDVPVPSRVVPMGARASRRASGGVR